MTATAHITSHLADLTFIVVERDPDRDRDQDDQPVPPDVAQALRDLVEPSLQAENARLRAQILDLDRWVERVSAKRT